MSEVGLTEVKPVGGCDVEKMDAVGDPVGTTVVVGDIVGAAVGEAFVGEHVLLIVVG